MKRTPFVADLVLLTSLLACVRVHAQTLWTKGTTYEDPNSTFTLTNGTGQKATDNPIGDVNVSVVPNPNAMGNVSDGVGVVYQPYTWGGGTTRTPLNVQVNFGANGSGSGSYQVTSDVHINSNSGGQIGQGGQAPSSFSYPTNATTDYLTDIAAAGGSNWGAYAPGSTITYLLAAHLSVDARIFGSGGGSQGEATVVCGQPY